MTKRAQAHWGLPKRAMRLCSVACLEKVLPVDDILTAAHFQGVAVFLKPGGGAKVVTSDKMIDDNDEGARCTAN